MSIAPQNAYASLETTTFGYSSTGNIITGYTYDLTYERGTLITIAGAGFGRDDSAAIDAETVSNCPCRRIIVVHDPNHRRF